MSGLFDQFVRDVRTFLVGPPVHSVTAKTTATEASMSVEELNAEIAGEVDRLATAAKDAVHAIIDTYEASKTATTEVPAVDAAAAEPATGPVAEPEPEAEAATEDTGTATPAAETAETGAGADPSTVKWND